MSPDVEALLQGHKTVADKIRALAAAGYPRAEIARMLGKRYQHVRNVLEEPKAAKALQTPTLEGMAEGDARPFQHAETKTYRLEVKNGAVTLPPEVLEALGASPNGVIIADLGPENFNLISGMTAIKRIQERLRPYWKPGVSVVDEFIAERRREAEREDREADEYKDPASS